MLRVICIRWNCLKPVLVPTIVLKIDFFEVIIWLFLASNLIGFRTAICSLFFKVMLLEKVLLLGYIEGLANFLLVHKLFCPLSRFLLPNFALSGPLIEGFLSYHILFEGLMILILLRLWFHNPQLLLKDILTKVPKLGRDHIWGPYQLNGPLMIIRPRLRFFYNTLLSECLFDLTLPSYRRLLVIFRESFDVRFELLLVRQLMDPNLMVGIGFFLLEVTLNLSELEFGVPLLSMLLFDDVLIVQKLVSHPGKGQIPELFWGVPIFLLVFNRFFSELTGNNRLFEIALIWVNAHKLLNNGVSQERATTSRILLSFHPNMVSISVHNIIINPRCIH